MNRYQPSTPRGVLGLSAVAMAAATIGALVVLPAKLDGVSIAPGLIDVENAVTHPTMHMAAALSCADVPDVADRDDYVRGHAAAR
jgi:hypothetical protein